MNELILYKSLLIKIMMLKLRGLTLGVPSSSHFLNIDMSSTSLLIFQYRT